MKIGVLIAGLSPPYGAERATASLVEGFRASGAEVIVFLLDTDTHPALKVPVSSMLHGRTLSLLEKFLYAPVQYVRLRGAVRRERPDVMISVLERANIFNLLLPPRHVKVLSIHTFLSSGLRVNGIWRRVFTRFFYQVFLCRADVIVAVSQLTMNDFQQMFPVSRSKICVMNNPLDPDAMRARAVEHLQPSHRALLEGDSILHVGRFTCDKGQWCLIRAMPRIILARPEAKLVLLGDGEMRRDLEQMVSDLSLGDRVHFLGYQPNPLKFMARTRVLVACSTREGFPNALIEALACGAPVVSTDCKSGPRELLAPGSALSAVAGDVEHASYGLLVPPVDPRLKVADEPLDRSEECLSSAIIRMLEDEDLRAHYRRRGPERVEEFNVPAIVSSWMDLLSRLAAAGGQAPQAAVDPENT